jgi:hypothetical protein
MSSPVLDMTDLQRDLIFIVMHVAKAWDVYLCEKDTWLPTRLDSCGNKN